MVLSSASRTNPKLLILEFGLTAIATATAFAWPQLCASVFRQVEAAFGRLARRKGLASISVGLSAILVRLAILPWFPVPLPFVPDDFSFLLASDTFAHGRLANPTPAMWIHFESIHITMKPTYMSMYFPGQGLLLAAGQAFLGHPWVALLIADGLFCAALCWMLQAWLPANWAMLGGWIAVIRLGLFSDWINTYHTAGSLAALGGALILGGLPRLIKTARFRYGLLMGIGVVLVEYTRPYEGLFLCIPAAVVIVHWAMKGKNRPSAMVLMRRAALPMAIVAAGGAWMGYYDLKAFGKVTTLPYTVDRAQYAIAPYYVWQSPRPEPHYRYEVIRSFYQKEKGEMGFYSQIHSIRGFIPYTLEKAAFTMLFYAGLLLLPPLIMVHYVFLDRRIRFLLICVLFLVAGLLIEIYLLPHYVAPFVSVFYAIGLQMMRHLRLWKPEGRQMGLAMVRWTVALCVILGGLRLFADPLHMTPPEWPPSNWNFVWFGPGHFGVERAQIESRLEQLPGPQLVIVRYEPDHNPLDEWVYNAANIDDSKVIWAREMDAADNLELLRYYRGRRVWLVEPDATPVRITPYPMAAAATAAH